MLQEPNVQVLAGHMQAIIEKALIRKTADQHTATAIVS